MTRAILIAGAGIGGLAAAVALRLKNIDVQILEQAEALREVGAGLQLGPNALHVLDKLGVKKQVINTGFLPKRALLRDYKTGRAQLTVALNPHLQNLYGQPFVQIHRADLQGILAVRARELGAKLHLGVRAQHYQQTEDSVSLQSADETFHGDLLIGADGVKSSIRAQMHPDINPKFTGHMAWRAVIPASHIPPGTLSPDATIWMGPDRHLVAYFIRGGALINLVAVIEQDSWVDEGWSRPGKAVDLRRLFADFAEPAQTLLSKVDNCFEWGLFAHAPLKSWQEGRISLLGDAAHPMLPFMAQGAAMAIEDGYVLAQCAGMTNMKAALGRYQDLRLRRTARLQAISSANAKLYHARGRLPRLWRRSKFTLASALPVLSDMKLAPIYGYKFENEDKL